MRYSIRQLIKNPGFALGVVLTLALAIGANTAEFSLIRAVLVKPLPWPNADRLVFVWNTFPSIGWPVAPVSIPDYIDRRNKTDCFSDSALLEAAIFNLATGRSPEQITGLRVTPSFFTTLGAFPSRGRAFTADDVIPGGEKIAVISHDLWQAQFGGREGILGTDIRLNGENYRVVGVMPKDFVSPNLSLPSIDEPNIQLWVPFAFTGEESRGNWSSVMIARLRSGISFEQAQQQIDAIYLNEGVGENKSVAARKAGGFGGIIAGYREQNIQLVRPMLRILQTAAVLIFLIACANVANLLLVRAITRRKELAIRLALGGGRFRIMRQLFTENMVLALIGGALGLLVGYWGLDLFGWLYDHPWLNRQTTSVDGMAVGFNLALSLGSALFFGLVTTISLSLRDPGEILRSENVRGSVGHSSVRTRATLIIAEVALATTLLIAAGLTLRSFVKLRNEPPGFASDNVLTARVSLPPTVYKNSAAQSAFYGEILKRVRALPGVKSASAISYLPFSGTYSTNDYQVWGEKRESNKPDFNGQIEVIDPTYFQAMQIPLQSGRTFSDADAENAAPTVIIDQFLAKRRFAGRDPIGLKIKSPNNTPVGDKWCTIVGVVSDVKAAGLAEPILKETLYFPLSQRPQLMMTLLLKTEADPRTLTTPLRETIQRVDPELPIFDVRTMDQRVAGSLVNYRSPMILLAIFGATALGLASLGLYGVLAYSVSQRTKEIGIRIALGAEENAILGLVVGNGMRLTLFGVVLGLGAAFGLTRLLDSLLFRVSANDPFTYIAVSSLLCTVALLASYLPARRATKVDAILALRSE